MCKSVKCEVRAFERCGKKVSALHSSNVRVNPSVADYHTTNGKAAPQLVGRLGDFKAAATAAVSFGCDDEHVVVSFGDGKIRA